MFSSSRSVCTENMGIEVGNLDIGVEHSFKVSECEELVYFRTMRHMKMVEIGSISLEIILSQLGIDYI